MRRFKLAVMILAALNIVFLVGRATGAIPAIRINGLQITSLSSTTIASGKQGVWVDNSATPRLRYDDGTNSRYVATGTVAAKGDMLVFNGTDWTALGVGSDTYVLTADHTQTSGVKWAAGGGGSVTVNTTSPIAGGSGTPGTSWTISCPTCIVDGTSTLSNGVTLLKAAIGTVTTMAMTLQNTTTAALNSQQYSPALVYEGRGWSTGSSASQSVLGAWQLRPIQGSSVSWELAWQTNINGAGYSDKLRLTQDVNGYGVLTGAASGASIGFALGELDFYPGTSTGASPQMFLASGQFGSYTSGAVLLGTSAHAWKRLYVDGSNAIVADFTNATGWGSTASVGSISGNDSHLTFTITSSGTGQTANPTFTYTFHDGTYTTTPAVICNETGSTDSTTFSIVYMSVTATSFTGTWVATPTATKTYTFTCLVSA